MTNNEHTIERELPKPVGDGFYTIVYPNGDYRTLRIKTAKQGKLEGCQIVGYLSGSDNTSSYTNVAFLEPNGRVRVWRGPPRTY